MNDIILAACIRNNHDEWLWDTDQRERNPQGILWIQPWWTSGLWWFTHSHTHTHISLCHLPRKCVCFYNLRRLLSSTFRREITLGWCAKPAERSTFTSMASTKVRRIKTLHEGERGPAGGRSHVMVINKWLRNTRKMGTSETWTDLFVFFSFLLFLYFCYPVIPWCFTQ